MGEPSESPVLAVSSPIASVGSLLLDGVGSTSALACLAVVSEFPESKSSVVLEGVSVSVKCNSSLVDGP